MNADIITAKAQMAFVWKVLWSEAEAVEAVLTSPVWIILLDALKEVDNRLDKASKPKPPTIHRLSFSAEDIHKQLDKLGTVGSNENGDSTFHWNPIVEDKFTILGGDGDFEFVYDEDTNHPREEKAKLTEVIAIIDAEMERLNAEINMLDTANDVAGKAWR